MVFLLDSRPESALRASGPSVDETATPAAPPTRPLKGRAGLPPPLILGPRAPGRGKMTPRRPGWGPEGAPIRGRRPRQPRPTAALTLQAISERDARPMPHRDRVKEGDKLGAVTSSGSDRTSSCLPRTAHDTIHFPLPPNLAHGPMSLGSPPCVPARSQDPAF
jgi:hypothetical protein